MRDPRFATSRWPGYEPTSRPEEIDQAWALGRKLGMQRPSPELLELPHKKLEHAVPESWDAFYDGYTAALYEHDEHQSVWTEFLRAKVAETMATPGSMLLSARPDLAALNEASRAWREEQNPFAVWGHQHNRHFAYRGDQPFSSLRLLLAIDRCAWCVAVDGLISPAMMKMAFVFANVHQDQELILELLRVAPPVFDVNGLWLPSRSVVALLAVEQIVEHARALHEAVSSRHRSLSGVIIGEADTEPAEDELQALEAEGLPNWMSDALTTLIRRLDGRHIALGLLGDLAREELVDRRSLPGTKWRAERLALLCLTKILAATGIGIRDVHDAERLARLRADEGHRRNEARRLVELVDGSRLSEEKAEGARTLRGEGLPLLLGAAILLGGDPDSPDEPEAFWLWFEELLVGRDPGLSLVRHGASVSEVPQRFGFLLSRTRDPGALFRRTYVKLESQRRRAAYMYRYNDFDNDLGSVVLIRVGLHAVVNWSVLQEGENLAPVREFFWWLYEAARRLWLTGGQDTEHTKHDLVSLSFAFIPRVFGDALGDALCRAVPPISNDARLVAQAAWFLWKNGVSPTRLNSLFHGAGADLEGALRDAHQWAKLTSAHAQHPAGMQTSSEFPTELYDLARELRLPLEIEVSEAPLQTKLARHRTAFMHSLPWGKNFLDRLKQDNCVLSRLEPLDAAGVTWLVQALIPSDTRTRFGLSPEIRGLVVHGQVRGRELRMALQDPRGAAAIDPDLLLIVSDQPDLDRRLPMLAGPWGQRVPWPPLSGCFAPLDAVLREQLPLFDLYDYRDPVRGNALVGRAAEVDDLAVRLLRGEAVGVVGLRKVGKSSLLRAVVEVLDPIGARRGMFESLSVTLPDAEPEALVVSLDVQGVVGRDLSVLLDRLCNALKDRLALARISISDEIGTKPISGALLPPEQVRLMQDAAHPLFRSVEPRNSASESSIDRFRNLLALATERAGVPVCFVLDEYDLLFEGYGGEPGIPGVEQLFSLLRAETHTTQRVSLVLIGRDPTFLDAPLLGGFTNPLAGWAKHVYLGPLQRDGADELLTRVGKRVGLEIGDSTRAAAWAWTAGHPLLIRQYGAALFEMARNLTNRTRPVQTDPIIAGVAEVFVGRSTVQTVCTEVHALLEARYPSALDLLEALVKVAPADVAAVLSRDGDEAARAADVLGRFGLLVDKQSEPWIPDVFRKAFSTALRGTQMPTGRLREH